VTALTPKMNAVQLTKKRVTNAAIRLTKKKDRATTRLAAEIVKNKKN
jgi:hypothetical protein